MKPVRNISLIVITIAIVGVVGFAFAHDNDYGYGRGMGGYGYGYGMMGPGMMDDGYGYGMMHGGRGYGMMGPGMMNYGRGDGRYQGNDNYADLSKKDADRLQQALDKFYESTDKLRSEIRNNQFALNDELDRTNPDSAKVTQLQKELSRLRADYDQKALAYQLEVRKILPAERSRRDFDFHNGHCRW